MMDFSTVIISLKTILVSQNQVSCRLEEFFPEPNSFLPERWIKDSIYYKKSNP
jgi:ecdysteroid 25-hydroxylase CYP302A1